MEYKQKRTVAGVMQDQEDWNEVHTQLQKIQKMAGLVEQGDPYTVEDIHQRLGGSFEAIRLELVQNISTGDGTFGKLVLSGADVTSTAQVADFIAQSDVISKIREQIPDGGYSLGSISVQEINVTIEDANGNSATETYHYNTPVFGKLNNDPNNPVYETQPGYSMYTKGSAPFPITPSQAMPGGGGTFPMTKEAITATTSSGPISIYAVVILQIGPVF